MLDVILGASASSFSRCRSVTPTPVTGSEGGAMVFDYALAGLVTAGLMIYLVYALLRPERLVKGARNHDLDRLGSNSSVLRDHRGASRRCSAVT